MQSVLLRMCNTQFEPHPFFYTLEQGWIQVLFWSIDIIHDHCTARFLSSFPLDGAQETLSQSDDMKILEELLPAKNQTVFLARKLIIPDHTVETIHKEQTDQTERLYRVIQEFLKGVEPRPTWRVILDALRSPAVNLPRLAEDIERRHCFHTPASEPTSLMGILLLNTREPISRM